MGFDPRRRAIAQGWHARHRFLGLHRRVFLKAQAVRATLTTAMTGTNNDVLVSALYHGTAGNSIRFRVVVAGASTPASVAVSGNDITFNSATNGSSAATSTGAQMVAAVNADANAAKLVFLQNAAGNDGTGVVAAFAFTNLTGGA
jgi:hypothetical protein